MSTKHKNTSSRPVESLVNKEKNVLLCNSFKYVHIESIFGMQLLWDNRHQPHN